MTTFSMRLAAAATAAATAVVVASCSAATTSEDRATATATATSTAAASAEHNSQDVMFAHMMIPHHEQALELSALVPDRSTNAELVALAAKIAAAQKPEIDTMKRLLGEWGAAMGDMGGMDHGAMMGGPMMGMVDKATMDKLATLKGADFDRLWLTSMIGHHEGAISMSKPEAKAGKNPELVAMAGSIITSQQAEIDQMKSMLAALGG